MKRELFIPLKKSQIKNSKSHIPSSKIAKMDLELGPGACLFLKIIVIFQARYNHKMNYKEFAS